MFDVGFYSVIPATVRYDKELSANAKLMYGEITSLCSKEGFCWATNKYFMDLYGVSKMTVIRWINQLKNKGYIYLTIKYRAGTHEIEARKISLVEAVAPSKKDSSYGDKVVSKMLPPLSTNSQKGGITDVTTSYQKCDEGSNKNVTHIDIDDNRDILIYINNIITNYIESTYKEKALEIERWRDAFVDNCKNYQVLLENELLIFDEPKIFDVMDIILKKCLSDSNYAYFFINNITSSRVCDYINVMHNENIYCKDGYVRSMFEQDYNKFVTGGE